AYQLALNLRERLLEENDSEEVFDELMKEFSEDGRDENGDLYAPDGYTFVYSGQMVPEFEAGALALEVGQVGDIVATDYGYHIIMRIPVDDTSVREYAQTQVNESYMMNKLTQKWLDEAQVQVEPVYETIDPKDFYEKLTALNEELHPASTPEPTESGN
ncbi:MAG: peptidylprolyl isomerase, partial [Oscillospiraceae bacterium]|nr:peptidylprolyl isomerase [Oscillospiraceae bacterium]